MSLHIPVPKNGEKDHYQPLVDFLAENYYGDQRSARANLSILFTIMYINDPVERPPWGTEEQKEALWYLKEGKWEEYKKLRRDNLFRKIARKVKGKIGTVRYLLGRRWRIYKKLRKN